MFVYYVVSVPVWCNKELRLYLDALLFLLMHYTYAQPVTVILSLEKNLWKKIIVEKKFDEKKTDEKEISLKINSTFS